MDTRTLPIADIDRADYNPRVALTPDDPEYQAIVGSIDTHGHVLPLVWNATTERLVGGHQRLTVLEDLGHTEATVVVVTLDEHDEKLLNLALNKIQGRWDEQALLALVDELTDAGTVDFEPIGFHGDDYTKLLKRADQSHATDFLDALLDEDVSVIDDDTQKIAGQENYGTIGFEMGQTGRALIITTLDDAMALHGVARKGDALAAMSQSWLDAQETADA